MSNAVTGTLSNQVVLPRARNLSAIAVRIWPFAILFLCLLFQLWARLAIIEASYHLEETRASALKNDVLFRELQARYAASSAPAALSERAKVKLGMTALPPQRMRRISLDTK